MALEPLDEVVHRTLTIEVDDPAPADLLRLYLELPCTVVRRGDREVINVRSSFEAAFTDAANVTNGGTSWIGAVGHLCFLDQLGTAVRRPSMQASRSSVERALEQFSDLDDQSRSTLYALRCALAHDYSLVNLADDVKPARRQLYRHHFSLYQGGTLEQLIRFPSTAWNGDLLRVDYTEVDLGYLGELVNSVRQGVLEARADRDLELRLEPRVFRRRYFFMHPAGWALPDRD